MSQPNMLITGATGFIGFKVLLLALKEGYTIRATVRNDAQPAKLISQLEANGLSSLQDRLSFFTVSDVLADDAYDQAVQGVTYVIHLASPLPNPALDPTTGVFEPSVKSVTNILASASKEATIKKVVITASVVGLLTFPPDPSKVHTYPRIGRVHLRRIGWDGLPRRQGRGAQRLSGLCGRAEAWLRNRQHSARVQLRSRRSSLQA